jgi:hypothetical protein
VQQVIDRAVAGRVPDRFLVGRLEIVDVQHLAGAGRFGKAPEAPAAAQQGDLNAILRRFNELNDAGNYPGARAVATIRKAPRSCGRGQEKQVTRVPGTLGGLGKS